MLGPGDRKHERHEPDEMSAHASILVPAIVKGDRGELALGNRSTPNGIRTRAATLKGW